jgi:hypothetical protein
MGSVVAAAQNYCWRRRTPIDISAKPYLLGGEQERYERGNIDPTRFAGRYFGSQGAGAFGLSDRLYDTDSPDCGPALRRGSGRR